MNSDDAILDIDIAQHAKKRIKLGPLFYLSVAWILIISLGAILAPYLPITNPSKIYATTPFAGPSLAHPLGADDLGRDIFSRIIFGGRVSLFIGIVSILVGLLFGGFFGLLAGYARKLTDTITNTLSNVLLSFPAIVFLLALVSVFGKSLIDITIGIALVAIPIFFRIVRAASLTVSQREYVAAAQVLGAKKVRILLKEVLPNVLPSALIVGLLGISTAIIGEGTLAYLGLSVALPTPSWGNIIAEGQDYLRQDPMLTIWPALAIILTVLSFNFIGQRLQRAFETRSSQL